jgi:hypothetical protein
MGLPAAKVGRILALLTVALPPLLLMLSISVGTVNIPSRQSCGGVAGARAEGTEGGDSLELQNSQGSPLEKSA